MPDAPGPPADEHADEDSGQGSPDHHGPKAGALGLGIGALGVVFGDIGTSPLYAFREAFEHQHLPVDRNNALGLASLAFWALVVIIRPVEPGSGQRGEVLQPAA